MVSPDGHCRAFDADAAGTVFGDGVGVVVLKRLADAERDGDTIYAVIRGTGVTNDGAGKASFAAPTAAGQAAAVRQALDQAGVERRHGRPTSRPTAPARRWATRSRSRG